MMRALITGVCGQDGSYLADILLERGYKVYGLYRHSSKDPFDNVRHNLSNPNFHLIQGDVTDALCLDEIIRKVDPHHIYHEADQDNVDWSFVHPAYQVDVTVKAVSNLLSSVRRHCPSARVFIPCSATMFGDAPAPQTESTPFNPLSPYACAKVAAYHLARMYRQNYGMFICTGILYNHDSPRRNGNYLLHKICKAAAQGEQLQLFDPTQRVAIGYAKDYMSFVVQLMDLDSANDYVVCNAKAVSLNLIAKAAYEMTGRDVTDYLSLCSSTTGKFRSPTLYGSSMKLARDIGALGVPDINLLLMLLIDKYGSKS
jgi:GDPmannose 4,6-dehydratase